MTEVFVPGKEEKKEQNKEEKKETKPDIESEGKNDRDSKVIKDAINKAIKEQNNDKLDLWKDNYYYFYVTHNISRKSIELKKI